MGFGMEVGIDLGTANVLVYIKGKGVVMNEPSVVALNKDTDEILAVGEEARQMLGRTPSNIIAVRPLRDGVVSDYDITERMLKYFIEKTCGSGRFFKPKIMICIPSGVTEVEKRAFYDLIKDSGVKAKKIMIVEKAVADGLGLDIDVKNSQGVLVVNVGYDTTEISILSLGGIVLSRLIKVGGFRFDEAIRSAVRKEFSLIIGGKTAENVKIALKDLEAEGKGAVVYGRDIVTGLPVEREIPTSLVDECLSEHFHTIIDNIKVILERTPPELAADIYRHGIYLTGGASQVNHLAERISQGTGLKVNVAETPLTSVAVGLSKIINEDNYKTVAYAIEGMSK